MENLILGLIVANALFVTLFGSVKVTSHLRSRLVVLLWVIFNTSLIYWMARSVGGHNPSFSPIYLDVSFPAYTIVGVCVSLLLLPSGRSVSKGAADLVFYLIVYYCTFLISLDVFIVLADAKGSEQQQVLAIFFAMASILICLLTPMASYTRRDVRPFVQYGIVNFKNAERHTKLLLKALGVFVVVVLVTNVFKYGSILRFFINVSPASLVKQVILETFYIVTLQHFVCFALPKHLLTRVSGKDEMIWGETILMAALYVGMVHNWPMVFIIRQLLFGLIIAYVYLRTGSLSYGIITCVLTKVFTV